MLKSIILSSNHLPELLFLHCTAFLRARNISWKRRNDQPEKWRRYHQLENQLEVLPTEESKLPWLLPTKLIPGRLVRYRKNLFDLNPKSRTMIKQIQVKKHRTHTFCNTILSKGKYHVRTKHIMACKLTKQNMYLCVPEIEPEL